VSPSTPNTRRLAVTLTGAAEHAVKQGHPWVFADGIKSASFNAPTGTTAIVFDRFDRMIGLGLWDSRSQIRLRMLGTGKFRFDAAWIDARIADSVARRGDLPARHSGWRAVYGESDGLPGLVIDLYSKTAVIKLYTAAWAPHLPTLVDVCTRRFAVERVVLRTSRNMQDDPALGNLADGSMLFGSAPEGPIVFDEYGIKFRADVISGQKTGFFLDQREHRRRVGTASRGAHVLNTFAYSGGFSLHAAAGGAAAVTSLDLAKPAIDEASANWKLNIKDPNIAACRHTTLVADAFGALEAMRRMDERFDIVILDPPAFAKRADEIDRAVDAYRRLTLLGLAVLRPGGLLVTCSCSRPVTTDTFVDAVKAAALLARRPLRDLHVGGHPPDHPTTFAPLSYLKSVFVRA